MEELKRKNLNAIIITLFYAVFTFIILLHHEVWSDEAQVWLISKNLSIFGLFKHLVNEGHPSLFYLLVMPFAKISNNIIFQQLICYFCSVISIFIIWRHTNLPAAAKTVITLSSPFIYHFPVIARNYSLVPLFAVLLGLIHPKRKEHPLIYSLLIAGMANTHAIMFPFSLILGGYFIYENCFKEKTRNKGFIFSYLIIALGLFATVAQLIGTTQSNVVINFENKHNLETFVRVVMLFIYNSFDDYIIKSNKAYFTIYPVTMMFLTIGAFVYAFWSLFKENRKLFYLTFFGIAGQIGIYTMAYGYYIFPTRIYCAYMIILFSYIVILHNKQCKHLTFAVIFLFSLTFINSFKSCYGDFLFDYTPSKRVANFILKNVNPDNSVIFINNPPHVIAVEYHLKNKMHLISIRNGKPLRYVIWNGEDMPDLSPDFLVEYFKFARKGGNKKDIYLLQSYNPFIMEDKADFDNSKDFDLLYVTGGSLMPTEALKLYRYKG